MPSETLSSRVWPSAVRNPPTRKHVDRAPLLNSKLDSSLRSGEPSAMSAVRSYRMRALFQPTLRSVRPSEPTESFWPPPIARGRDETGFSGCRRYRRGMPGQFVIVWRYLVREEH